MSRYGNNKLAPDPRGRERAIDIAETAGRMGATRVPEEAFAAVGSDPSDTAVHALLVALENGQLLRRERPKPSPNGGEL